MAEIMVALLLTGGAVALGWYVVRATWRMIKIR